jgi:arylsulfatase A-like enzyme
LIISVPQGLTAFEVPSAAQCNQPAELMDLYATLSQLTGLPIPEGQEGLSLVPQLVDPTTPRERPAICTHNAGNHSVCDTRWRYVVYADGAQELYDTLADPLEYTNLISTEPGAKSETYADVIERLSAFLPDSEAPLAPGSAARILEKREDGFYWEEKKIVPEDKAE